MKVTMKIKVYALLMTAVAMAGNVAISEVEAFESFLGNAEVILAEQGDNEDEGWFAEEFDSMSQRF